MCWLASTSLTNKKTTNYTILCGSILNVSLVLGILPAQRFHVLSSDYEHRTDTYQTFVGQTNIAQTCVAHSAIFSPYRNTSCVSTNVIQKQRLLSKLTDKPAGTIHPPCSIDVLCTFATHSTQILSEIVALCTLATRSTRKRPQIHFCNLTPHIFTRTQCSFIIKTTLLCRVEEHTTRTCFLPGVPRDTF